MRFYTFHLMPWPYLPADFGQTHDTAWVVCENDLYDPERGHTLYNRYLDELEYADKLGFDGIYISGGALSADLALPDIGLITLDELTTRGRQIAISTSETT